MKTMNGILAAAAAIVATTVIAGCMGDESAQSRPRTQNVLAPDEKSQDNAFNRETEAPKRDLPTSGREYPGQSRPTPEGTNEPTVITADAGHLNPLPYGHFRTPESSYDLNNYHSIVPPLPDKPGTAPMVGSTPVPGTGWAIDDSWGQVLPLENYAHRAWPDEQTTYKAAVVKHKPVYYFDIENEIPIKTKGDWVGNGAGAAIEIPWFYANTALLPVLMVLEPPLLQRTTERLGKDPIYHGYLPEGGDIIPSPTPGEIKWDYPFLRPDANQGYDQPTDPARDNANAGNSTGRPDVGNSRDDRANRALTQRLDHRDVLKNKSSVRVLCDSVVKKMRLAANRGETRSTVLRPKNEPRPATRMNQGRKSRALNLFPQITNVHIDHVAGRRRVHCVKAFPNVAAGDQLACLQRQKFEQSIFAQRE